MKVRLALLTGLLVSGVLLSGCASTVRMKGVRPLQVPDTRALDVTVVNDPVAAVVRVEDAKGPKHSISSLSGTQIPLASRILLLPFQVVTAPVGIPMGIYSKHKFKQDLRKRLADSYALYLRRKRVFTGVTRSTDSEHDLMLAVRLDRYRSVTDLTIDIADSNTMHGVSIFEMVGELRVLDRNGQEVKSYPFDCRSPTPFTTTAAMRLGSMRRSSVSTLDQIDQRSQDVVAEAFGQLASQLLSDRAVLEQSVDSDTSSLRTVAERPGTPVASGQRETYDQVREKAKAGDVYYQGVLAQMLFDGEGVKRDYREALEWAKLSAEKSNPIGIGALARMYDTGYGVRKSKGKAKRLHLQAHDGLLELAEKGNARARSALGTMYLDGAGVRKDYTKALEWLKLAATQGRPGAQTRLGYMYYQGLGLRQDSQEATKWFRKAAEQGFAAAQVNLGVSYRDGLGVAKNYDTAVKWFRKAAEQGDPKGQGNGQGNLGWMYLKGYGVSCDYVQAYAWLLLAKEKDVEFAEGCLKWLKKKMSRQQRHQAEIMAKDLRNKYEGMTEHPRW